MIDIQHKLLVRGGTALQHNGRHCALLAFWRKQDDPGPPDALYRSREFESAQEALEYYDQEVAPQLRTLVGSDAVDLDDIAGLLDGFEKIDPASIDQLTT